MLELVERLERPLECATRGRTPEQNVDPIAEAEQQLADHAFGKRHDSIRARRLHHVLEQRQARQALRDEAQVDAATEPAADPLQVVIYRVEVDESRLTARRFGLENVVPCDEALGIRRNGGHFDSIGA